MSNYIGIIGIVVLLGIAYGLSTNRKAINLRVVGAAFALQTIVAAFVLYSESGRSGIEAMSRGVLAIMGYSRAGIDMIFGAMASEAHLGNGVVVFAVHVLPIIIFFASLMAVLYHIHVMQWIVKIVGTGLQKVIGTGPVESMNAAANVFVGQTEAPLVVKPYLKGLTEPQMFAVMTSGLASVAGTVLVAYASFGAEMKYLLAASFMAAPGGLLMAKMLMPDEPESAGKNAPDFKFAKSEHENVFLAAASGASDGLRLAVNIGAMLIAFVALIALVNGLLGWVSGWFGQEWTLQGLLGILFSPLMAVIGVPWGEAQSAGALFGEKLILNEFVAFIHLEEYLAGASDRTRAIVTFSLCGFANLSSIAILLGGLGVLVPEKRDLIGRFGLRAVAAGSLSNLMSATLAGLMLTF
ncbi:MAG: NupC/NupG family nucleoside CNT transporter [Pseudomonadota bacterium]